MTTTQTAAPLAFRKGSTAGRYLADDTTSTPWRYMIVRDTDGEWSLYVLRTEVVAGITIGNTERPVDEAHHIETLREAKAAAQAYAAADPAASGSRMGNALRVAYGL